MDTKYTTDGNGKWWTMEGDSVTDSRLLSHLEQQWKLSCDVQRITGKGEEFVPAFAIVWDPNLVSRDDYEGLVGAIRNLVLAIAEDKGLDVDLVKGCSRTLEVDRETGTIREVTKD